MYVLSMYICQFISTQFFQKETAHEYICKGNTVSHNYVNHHFVMKASYPDGKYTEDYIQSNNVL